MTQPEISKPATPGPAVSGEGPANVVLAKGLVKRYDGRIVVDHVDFEVRRGECFGLLGPNGAGKTTTLRMLLGHTWPDAGALTVLGEPVPARAREARARIGVVPQFDNLDPDFTARENLSTFGSYFGLRGAVLKDRIDALLDFAALRSRADTPIAGLSGGMRRRLTLARALVNDPELVLLDEPTTGLDPQARHHIWQRLRGLLDGGGTLILTTHYMEEAERLCDRLAIIDAGRIIACGSPRELIETHIEPHVIEITGGDVEHWLNGEGARFPARIHRAGDAVFLYLHDAQAAIESLAGTGLRYLHRPAGLEDVFLKLTGHELRD